jgi:hypothetical protein
MNALRLSFILILLSVGCSQNNSEFKTPEHQAVVITDTPVFEGMIAAVRGSQLTTLKPLTVVYVTNSTISVNHVDYVGITWGDSSGYVLKSQLMNPGKVGVLSEVLTRPVQVFSDPNLTHDTNSPLAIWDVVAVGNINELSAEIMYRKGDVPVRGYIPKQSVSVDTLDVDFFYAFRNAEKQKTNGSSAAMETLAKDAKFIALESHKKLFHSEKQPAAGVDPHVYTSFANVQWLDATGNATVAPAWIAAYYIFNDGTESQVNSLPGSLWEGRPGPENDDNDKPLVEKIRLVLVPLAKTNFTFEIRSENNWDDPTGSLTRTFSNAEPGKTYSFIIEDGPLSANLRCSHITIKVSAESKGSTTSNIDGDCPGA